MSLTDLKEYFKSKLRGTASLDFLLSLTNRHKSGSKPDIFIFSMPRSGSTWLMEIIWSQTGFKYVNEPLDLSFDWLKKYSSISGFGEYYEKDVSEKLIFYFRNFSNGKSNFLNPSPFRGSYNFVTNRIVFKIIHGADLYINQILSSVNSKGIYLIRHPFDVSLSRKKISKTKELVSQRVLHHFTDEQRKFVVTILENGTHLEKGVMSWCIHNYIALSIMNNNVLVVFYEDLVLDFSRVSQSIYTHCALDNYEDMLKFEKKLSAVSVQSDSESLDLLKSEKRSDLVYKWQKKLTVYEAGTSYEILDRMGMSVYIKNKAKVDYNHLMLKGKRIA